MGYFFEHIDLLLGGLTLNPKNDIIVRDTKKYKFERNQGMDITIKKLSVDLLDDWLYYFDNDAFSDNGEWEGCYCMCYHWSNDLQKKKRWNCSKSDGRYNRKCAIDYIKSGKMQGYLAYSDNKVIGWCNANDKSAYQNVNFTLPLEESEKDKKVKSIVCFCIAPEYRGKGIATALLERICSDAESEGYVYVESYPFEHNANHSYHGPQVMYEKNGFVKQGIKSGYIVFRKYLNKAHS